MAGVQGSDPVLICIYTKKTLRWLRVAILEIQREKEGLDDERKREKERQEERSLRASRDALRRESNDSGNPISVASQLRRDPVTCRTLKDNFVTAEMHQRRRVCETRDCKIGEAQRFPEIATLTRVVVRLSLQTELPENSITRDRKSHFRLSRT